MQRSPISTFLTGAVLILLSSCSGGSDEHRQVTLKFAAAVGQDSARCGQSYSGLGKTAVEAELLDFRLYVSNIRLINSDGKEVPLKLDQDGRWQVDNVALLDFEDASGKCADAGTVEVRGEVTGSVPSGAYDGIAFELAVPFELNHGDLAAAPPPLNLSAMYWSWAIGHKFLRVDLETAGGNQWSAHLGSTMCNTDGPAEPPQVTCGRANRPVIAFNTFDPDHDTIVLDLKELFATSDLATDTPDSSAGCQSFPDDVNECTSLFSTLGLEFLTGECAGECAQQTCLRLRNLEASATERTAAAQRGASTFSRMRYTVGGAQAACAECHGADGSGLIGPDIRSSSAGHFQEHAQGDGPHPEGVKFPGLSASDFDDIEAYLVSQCNADSECEPRSEVEGHH